LKLPRIHGQHHRLYYQMNLGTVPVKVTGLKVKMTVPVKLLNLMVKVTVPVMETLKMKVMVVVKEVKAVNLSKDEEMEVTPTVKVKVKVTVKEVKAVNVSSEDEELELTEVGVVKPEEEGKKAWELP